MIAALRKRLAWKLFLSYMIVILIGVIVLATAAELTIPNSFQRHLAAMGAMMNDMMGGPGGGMGIGLSPDLFANYRRAVNEALLIAAAASILAAVVVSLLISRRIVAPVREMMAASQRIAQGKYDERVTIPGGHEPSEMDELANLAVSFNQMAARLDRTEAMRRQLIGNAAHELRTPLSTIKGTLEGLMDGVLPADISTYLRAYREAERMQHLIQDVQELSRVESGAYELERQRVPLAELIESARLRLEQQYREKGVELAVEVPSSDVEVYADPMRIEQVLLNLLGNALQYTASGGSVRVTTAHSEQETVVSIEDDGIGIPLEHQEHIFNRFYRVDKSRSRAGGGSGIGLTIAKHIIEAHGGRIWVESPGVGQGSTFSFSLPWLVT
ncbi:MAG: ATP-binding protein [Anaerolineales bacterium]|nr:ATP-binding protein [Anaerolineales bacterium]